MKPPGGVDASADTSLLARLRDGEEAAYRELVSKHAPRLLAVARRFLRTDEDARDALQEAFVQAFRALPRFEAQSQLSTWLHRIVVNAALMRLRRQRSRPEESIEPLLPTYLDDGHQTTASQPWFAGHDDSAERRLERRETCELVRGAIDRLPETYRTVLLMRDIEDLDTSEAADALGITENAVKIRLHRARQALRGILDPHFRTTP